MKKTLIALVLCLVSGCETARVVLRPRATNEVPVVTSETVPQTVMVEVVRTELNPVPGGPDLKTTNLVSKTEMVTRLQTNLIQVIVPEVAYTNVSLNPLVSSGIAVAGAVAPVPWAGAATGIFGVVSGAVFGFINERRRKKALGEAQDWQQTAAVLVQNVEAVRQAAMKLPAYTPSLDRKVVQGLQIAQAAAGVKAKIAGLVEEHTDFTHSLV